MKFNFVNIIQPSKPSGAKDFYRIPGTTPHQLHLKEGRVHSQQWDLDGFHIVYIQSILNEKIVFEMRYLGMAEILICCFKNRIEINSFSNPIARLNPEYAHIYTQSNFQAFCMVKQLRQKSSLLLVTHPLSHLPGQSDSGSKTAQPFLMQAGMVELVEKMIHTSYAEPRPFHVDQLHALMVMARNASVTSENAEHFDDSHIHGLHAAKGWLDNNIDKEYSESMLVQKAGMNIKKLNKGFTSLFGYSPFQYLRISRLTIAHEKISTTKTNLKTIARNAHYRNYPNFSSAFKKYFGYSPGSLRNKETL